MTEVFPVAFLKGPVRLSAGVLSDLSVCVCVSIMKKLVCPGATLG